MSTASLVCAARGFSDIAGPGRCTDRDRGAEPTTLRRPSPKGSSAAREGAGLDSGAPAAARSAMPSIAAPCHRTDRHSLFTNAAAPAAPQLQARISTSLTDVTQPARGREHALEVGAACLGKSRK
jgi:hypothetical protein